MSRLGLRLTLAASLLVCVSIRSAADGISPLAALPAVADLPARWTGVMDLFDTPGMAVAVVANGRIYAQGFGLRNPATGDSVTPETLFYIASITKTFTATAICALMDDGRLRLDDPVRQTLPRLQLADAALAEKLTLRDLLCHRHGIDSGPIVMLDAFTGEITEDRYYHWLQQAAISHQVNYSNVHFTLLGRVIEAVTGKPWRDFLQERVLQPAGMPRTTGYATRLYGDVDAAVPLERRNGQWVPVAQRKTDCTMHAAGGLGTSAVEGARWLLLHLNDGVLDGKRVLAKDSARAMRETQSRLAKPTGTIRVIEGFGLAWNVGSFNGHRLCQHSGGYEGASAYMAMLPDDGVGVVILINAAGYARGLGDIVAVDVMERLTKTKSVFDVYGEFTAEVQKKKAKAAAENAGTQPASSQIDLSRSLGQYSGSFWNAWCGTLRVTVAENSLALQLGDTPLEIGPVGRDEFVIAELLDEKTPGRFLVGNNGTVEAIRLQHPTLGEVEFHR